ncbi:tRNA lysidine(34) synthetase TilS [Natronospora cellulosivora (SeqCode)]
MDIFAEFRNYIRRNNLIRSEDSLILGVSGGPDSLVMLDLFARIMGEYNLDIVVFHLNHMFRKEAEKEAEYVRSIAQNYQLKSFIEKFDVPKYIQEYGYSPEEGARKARFDILRKLSEKSSIKKIAMAHNKDDLVETVLFNLIRGTGLKGLTGIDAKMYNDKLIVIHPLLSVSRKSIEKYCLEHKLNPVRDPSNTETYYTRNKIRNDILPYIEKEINPAVKDVVYRMSTYLREEEDFLTSFASEVYQRILIKRIDKKVVLSLPLLQDEEEVIRKRILKMAVKELQGNAMDLYSVHYNLINDIIFSGETGKSIDLKEDIRVKVSYEHLIFESDYSYDIIEEFNYDLAVPGKLKKKSYIITTEILSANTSWKRHVKGNNVCLCDFDKIKYPLKVRSRQDGDKFYPFGMNGSKKIKDFFIDEKIPLDKRNSIPLVVDNRRRIVWVSGYRADNRFKIDNKTKKILKIRIKLIGGD